MNFAVFDPVLLGNAEWLTLSYLDGLIHQEQANSKCVISSALITRYLERIADHAVYVCESIVYIVNGEEVDLG